MTEALTVVAGGAGFIGSHLCHGLLDDGHRVLCLDNMQTGSPRSLAALQRRPGFEFLLVDVSEPLPRRLDASLASITRVYNLACAASPPHYQRDPEHTMLSNVVGTDQLLRMAERCDARFLLASTSEIYGDPAAHPQPEDYRGNVSCTGPRACYDEGKRAAEALCFDFVRTGRVDARVARIFNTYGPGMSPDDGRAVSNFICQSLAGKPLTVYGDGSQTRSFCYVKDTVEGLRRLMESETTGGEPVNIGNPDEITIASLVEAVQRLTGHIAPVVREPLPVDDPTRRQPVIDRARDLLGWSPTTSLAEGLTTTIAWFRDEDEKAPSKHAISVPAASRVRELRAGSSAN